MKRLLLALFASIALFAAPIADAQVIDSGLGGSFNGGKAAGGGGAIMSTPLLSLGGSGSNFPSTTAINYVSLMGGSNNATPVATLVNKQYVFPVAGTIGGLEVSFPTTIGVGSSYNIILNIAGSPTALACNVTNGAQTCADAVHNIAVTAGALVTWEICPSAASAIATGCPTGTAPAAQTTAIQISALFTSTVGQESPLFAGSANNGPVSTSGAVSYAGFGSQSWAASDALGSSIISAAGTIDQFYIQEAGTLGAGASMAFVVLKNGAVLSPSVTCTVTTTTTCHDLTDSFTVAAGDTVSIQATASSTAPTARNAFAGFRWVPSTTNQAMLFDVAGTVPSVTGTKFLIANGAGANGATDAPESNIAPVLSTHMTLGNLIVGECPGPGAGVTRTVTLRAGGVSQTPSATIAASTTACPTLSTKTDTNTYQASSGVLLDFQTTVSGTNTTLTEFKTGMTVTVP